MLVVLPKFLKEHVAVIPYSQWFLGGRLVAVQAGGAQFAFIRTIRIDFKAISGRGPAYTVLILSMFTFPLHNSPEIMACPHLSWGIPKTIELHFLHYRISYPMMQLHFRGLSGHHYSLLLY